MSRLMRIDRTLESSMAMSGATWDRHANPWSVYTRLPVLMLFVLAVWSRIWIGWWSLLPLVALAGWTIFNPRAFPPPASTDNWASKAVLGERVWLNREAVPIPSGHARWATGLSLGSGVALIPTAWGLYALEPWAAFLGGALASLFKVWFVDRMVWLYEDMKDEWPAYRSWLR